MNNLIIKVHKKSNLLILYLMNKNHKSLIINFCMYYNSTIRMGIKLLKNNKFAKNTKLKKLIKILIITTIKLRVKK